MTNVPPQDPVPPAPAPATPGGAGSPPPAPPQTAEVNLLEEEGYELSQASRQATAQPSVVPYDEARAREGTRGDLARGLLWLLTLTIGGMIVFVGLGRLEGSALAQSVFPSLVTLAGTALGFYFGSQSARGNNGGQPPASGDGS